MARAKDDGPRWDPTWTDDDLVESFEELAELEHFADEVVAEAAPVERAALELIATLERTDEHAAAEPFEEAEAYAVHPELYLLAALAAYPMRGALGEL